MIEEITREEFETRLKEDKFFEDCTEFLNYRMPVIAFFIKNYVQPLKNITLLEGGANEFILVNNAFETIKKGLKL